MKILVVYGIPDDNFVKIKLNEGIANQLSPTFKGVNVIAQLLDNEKFTINNLVFGGIEEKINLQVQKPDIIYNAICNYDIQKRSLSSLSKNSLIQNTPIINHPQGIARTTRNAIYEQFTNNQYFKVPKTVRVTPSSVQDVFKLAKQHGLKFPFIFRSIGENNANNMERISEKKDQDLLEKFAFDGREFYLIEYHEYKSADNLYRKYRALVIDGELILRHILFSDVWKNANFDGHQKVVQRMPEIIKEEEEFLKNEVPDSIIQTAKALYDYTKLDFFGFDFSLDEKNNLFLFEANSCMLPYYRLDYGPQHLQQDAKKIKQKLENMFIKKAKQSCN